MKLRDIFIGVIAVAGLVLGGLAYTSTDSQSLGATPGGDFTNLVNFSGGVVNSGLVATTSQGSSVTISAAEFRNWANSSMVEFKQGLVATPTLTFPASSSLSALVPKPGDRQTFCIRNATSTASLNVILAGSTGVNLNVASSSVSALGAVNLATGEVGCITLVRQSATATTYDIDALLTVFK